MKKLWARVETALYYICLPFIAPIALVVFVLIVISGLIFRVLEGWHAPTKKELKKMSTAVVKYPDFDDYKGEFLYNGEIYCCEDGTKIYSYDGLVTKRPPILGKYLWPDRLLNDKYDLPNK